jgi:predicted  nucleic acid-binding Zn-ribbon protein
MDNELKEILTKLIPYFESLNARTDKNDRELSDISSQIGTINDQLKDINEELSSIKDRLHHIEAEEE